MPLLSFSCLLVLARMSTTVLSRIDENACLGAEFREKTLSYTTEYVSCKFFIVTLYQIGDIIF